MISRPTIKKGNSATSEPHRPFANDPYGSATVLNADWSASGAPMFEFGFQGGAYDSTSGLYNFRNRDYSTSLGRWMQRDPLGYVDGMSLYEFVRGNPDTHNDPYGLQVRGEANPPLPAEVLGTVTTFTPKIDVKSKTLDIDMTGEMRIRYIDDPNDFFSRLNYNNYQHIYSNINGSINFKNYAADSVVLNGRITFKALLKETYEGSFSLKGSVVVKPPGLAPNARVKKFEGNVTAVVAADANCHAVATVSGSGSPDFFLLQLLVPWISVKGRAEDRRSPAELGVRGVVGLIQQAIKTMEVTAYLFGFIPIRVQ